MSQGKHQVKQEPKTPPPSQTSLQEVGSELAQMQAELQIVWDKLKAWHSAGTPLPLPGLHAQGGTHSLPLPNPWCTLRPRTSPPQTQSSSTEPSLPPGWPQPQNVLLAPLASPPQAAESLAEDWNRSWRENEDQGARGCRGLRGSGRRKPPSLTEVLVRPHNSSPSPEDLGQVGRGIWAALSRVLSFPGAHCQAWGLI